MKGAIESLIYTLCRIEVRGKENLDMLLGCIQTLEKMRGELAEKEASGDDNHDEQGT